MAELSGLFVPILTFFCSEGDNLDLEILNEHVEFLISAGANGIITNGSTGDFHALSPAEQGTINRTVIEKVAGRIPVLVGTTSLTTQACIDASRLAADIGATGVMVAPPFYLPLSDAELCLHFDAVSKAIEIPILAYNNPLTTGQNLYPELVLRLYESAGIHYVKESSGVINNFQRIVQLTRGAVKVFMGEEPLSAPALMMGCQGIVMGLGNGIPEWFIQLIHLVEERRIQETAQLHLKALPLYDFVANMRELDYNNAIKSILKQRFGWDCTSTRPPSLPLTDSQEKSLGDVLSGMGVSHK